MTHLLKREAHSAPAAAPASREVAEDPGCAPHRTALREGTRGGPGAVSEPSVRCGCPAQAPPCLPAGRGQCPFPSPRPRAAGGLGVPAEGTDGFHFLGTPCRLSWAMYAGDKSVRWEQSAFMLFGGQRCEGCPETRESVQKGPAVPTGLPGTAEEILLGPRWWSWGG